MKIFKPGVAVVLSFLFGCGGAPTAQSQSPSQSTAATAPASASVPAAEKPVEPKAQAATASMFDLQLKSLRDYVHAFNRHDAKAIAALYAEEAAFIERGEGASSGSESIETNFQTYFRAFPDATTSITRSWHWGDAVLFEYFEGGTNTGETPAHKPSGKKIGYLGASVMHFKPDGHVRSDTTYSDELTREVQAGWAPGVLAKLEVRPVVPAPPITDNWEVHKASATANDAEQQKVVSLRKKLYSSFSVRSEKDFLAALSDDVVLYPYDDPKDAKGKREAANLFKDWLKTFSDGVINASDAWSVDGYVVVVGTFSGKHVGSWGPLKPTNKTFKTTFLDIARTTKDGNVDRLWTYANNYELLQYLGYEKVRVRAVLEHDPMGE